MKLLHLLPALFAAVLAVSSSAVPLGQFAYDSKADPDKVLNQAIKQAQDSGKHILLVAGGDWCRWCKALEAFVHGDTDVRSALDKSFVTVEVYYGEENSNFAFFSKLPPALGYPHFWVLSKDGKVLTSRETNGFEDGNGSYDKGRLMSFITSASKS
jgi:thiol:disulfide interchange protein